MSVGVVEGVWMASKRRALRARRQTRNRRATAARESGKVVDGGVKEALQGKGRMGRVRMMEALECKNDGAPAYEKS